MDLSELKDSVLSVLGQVTDRAGGITGKAAGKVKSGGRMAKIAMDAAGAREELKKTYLEIGKLYYDTHKDDPEGFFIQLFEEVRASEESIASMENELSALRESFKGKDPEAAEAPEEFECAETVEDAFAETVDEAEAQAEAAAEADAEAGETSRAFLDRMGSLKDLVQEKAGTVKDVVAGKAEIVKDVVAGKAEVVKDVVTEKAGVVKEAVTEKVAELRGAAADKAEEAAAEFEAVVGKAEDVAGEAAEAIEEVASEVKEELKDDK